MTTCDAHLHGTFPEGGAPPADDARKVLLNAAPVVEDAKKKVVAADAEKPPPRLQDDEEVRDVMEFLDESSAEADPSAMNVVMTWHPGAEHPSLNRAGMVCVRMVAARNHSMNEGVPPPTPKGPTKNYYCYHCCWRSG